MTDPAIVRAAAWALQRESLDHPDQFEAGRLAVEVLTAVTPLIRADALEEAAKVAEGHPYYADTAGRAIRALKEQP